MKVVGALLLASVPARMSCFKLLHFISLTLLAMLFSSLPSVVLTELCKSVACAVDLFGESWEGASFPAYNVDPQATFYNQAPH